MVELVWELKERIGLCSIASNYARGEISCHLWQPFGLGAVLHFLGALTALLN